MWQRWLSRERTATVHLVDERDTLRVCNHPAGVDDTTAIELIADRRSRLGEVCEANTNGNAAILVVLETTPLANHSI